MMRSQFRKRPIQHLHACNFNMCMVNSMQFEHVYLEFNEEVASWSILPCNMIHIFFQQCFMPGSSKYSDTISIGCHIGVVELQLGNHQSNKNVTEILTSLSAKPCTNCFLISHWALTFALKNSSFCSRNKIAKFELLMQLSGSSSSKSE